jgi:N-acetylmuramoyl-L-alanine amidase
VDKKSELQRRKEARRRARRRRVIKMRIAALSVMAIIVVIVVRLIMALFSALFYSESSGLVKGDVPALPVLSSPAETHNTVLTDEDFPGIQVDLLTVNPYSRPGTKLEGINNIVVHYTGNPRTRAQSNRNYFESLKDSHEASASSHFVVGLEGEVIQCIPVDEVAYASNNRNGDTISIETCHETADGKFNEETYNSLVYLSAYLCNEYGLEATDVIRHYDVTGKICPKYYVNNQDAWEAFHKDVDNKMKELKSEE